MSLRIHKAVESMYRTPDGWVRLDAFQRVSGDLRLTFGIYRGKRGKRLSSWCINCEGVQHANITDWDGGGIAHYKSNHPAARQFFAREAEVRWAENIDELVRIGAFVKAHVEAVDDWIPFDSYSTVNVTSKHKFSCHGPDFLMRAYAKALRALRTRPKVTLRQRNSKPSKPTVLHFGDSYIVANNFVAVPMAEPGKV